MIDEGKYQEAILLLDNIIDDAPSSEAYLLRGNSYFSLGESNKAAISFLQAIELNSNAYEAWMHLGNIYVNSAQFALSLDAYDNAIKHNNKLGKLYINRGNVLFRFKRYPEAENDFKIALELEPQDPQPHFNYGRTLYMQQEFSNALVSFQKSHSLSESSESNYWLGVTYYQLSQTQKACSYLNIAADQGDQNAKEAIVTVCG